MFSANDELSGAGKSEMQKPIGLICIHSNVLLSFKEVFMFFIGSIRRFFFMLFDCEWNAWVRDMTAKLEGTWLIRSER